MVDPPPPYLGALPDQIWFYDNFGTNCQYVYELWKRQEMRRRLCEAQNHKCCYCGVEMTLDPSEKRSVAFATIEHVKRRVERGPDDEDNYVMACRPCNNGRGSIPAHLYKGPVSRVRVFK